MIVKASGMRALLFLLVFLAIVVALGILIFRVVLFLLPLILIIIAVSYLFKILNKLKKDKKKDYVDIGFRVKK